jgi:hypothetical protein
VFSRSAPERDKQGLPSVQKIPKVTKDTQEMKYKDSHRQVVAKHPECQVPIYRYTLLAVKQKN